MSWYEYVGTAMMILAILFAFASIPLDLSRRTWWFIYGPLGVIGFALAVLVPHA